MKKPKRNTPNKHACNPLPPISVLRKRLGILSQAFTRVDEFQAQVANAKECHDRQPLTQAARASIARFAYDAECHVRAAIHVGLETLNEARQGGYLSDIAQHIGRIHENKGTVIEEFKRVAFAVPDIATHLSHPGIVDQLKKVLEAPYDCRAVDDGIICEARKGGRKKQLKLRLQARSGDIGTVSPEEMFNAFGRGLTSLLPEIDDCHHKRVPSPAEVVSDPDIYGHLVGQAVAAREQTHRFVQEIQHLGFQGISGNEPIAGALIVLIVWIIIVVLTLTAAITVEVLCDQGNSTACAAKPWLWGIFGLFTGVGFLVLAVTGGGRPWRITDATPMGTMPTEVNA